MIAFLIAIGVSFWQITQTHTWIWLCVIGLLLLLCFKRQWFECVIACLFIVQLVTFAYDEPITTRSEQQAVVIEIQTIPTHTRIGCQSYGVKDDKQWLVIQKGEQCELQYGTTIQANIVQQPITGLQNYQLFQRQQFYHRQKNVIGEIYIQTIQSTSTTNWRTSVQQQLLRWLETRYDDETVTMLIKTLLFGETTTFDEDVRTTWQFLNISHILAMSGLHASIVILLLRWLCAKARLLKHWHPFIITIVLCLLRIFNFASISFTRVIIMWILQFMCFNRLNRYDRLLLASGIIACIFPNELLNVGFYYSFSCAFLLILGWQFWQTHWRILLLPLTLQLWLLPVTLWQTGVVVTIALLANIVAIPFITILVPLLLLTVLVPQFAPFVSGLYHIGVVFFDWLAAFDSGIVIGQLTFIGCCGYLVCLWVSYRYFEQRRVGKGILFISCTCLIVCMMYWYQPLELAMIDIGQGDAFVMIDGRKKACVIDVGGPMKLQDYHYEHSPVVWQYLRQRGITTIESLIISHGDLDHLGYAYGLFAQDQLRVEHLIFAAAQTLNEDEQRLIDIAKEHGTIVHFVQAGATISFGETIFHVLSPTTDQRVDINEHSLVLWAEIAGFNWLFTGDIGKKTEQQLVANYANLPVDILKVAHHGSKTSSSELFLATFQPKLALVSAGFGNRYGHPHQEVVDRYYTYGIPLLVSAEVGMIRMFPNWQVLTCFADTTCQARVKRVFAEGEFQN